MSDADELRALMNSEGAAVGQNTRGFNRGRYESVSRLRDYESLKTEARAIKEDAIERLPELVEQVRHTVEENGGTVYVAEDAVDANEYIRSVVDDRDAQRVLKSKSMTSEELEVNEALEASGTEVVETDLGEWVLQVADESPSHIVAPAIHKSRSDIADLFNETFEPDEPLETAEELTAFARDFLGELVEEADAGMTGANFITADTGTIALVTSEGNARKTVAATDTQIAVAGVEKIVPSVEDLHPFVELIGRSGTGQDITSYVSLLTPPVETPTVDFTDDERRFPNSTVTTGSSISSSSTTVAWRCGRTTSCVRRCTVSAVRPARTPVRTSSRSAATPSAARRIRGGSPRVGRRASRVSIPPRSSTTSVPGVRAVSTPVR